MVLSQSLRHMCEILSTRCTCFYLTGSSTLSQIRCSFFTGDCEIVQRKPTITSALLAYDREEDTGTTRTAGSEHGITSLTGMEICYWSRRESALLVPTSALGVHKKNMPRMLLVFANIVKKNVLSMPETDLGHTLAFQLNITFINFHTEKYKNVVLGGW